jgi:hypothetical protein
VLDIFCNGIQPLIRCLYWDPGMVRPREDINRLDWDTTPDSSSSSSCCSSSSSSGGSSSSSGSSSVAIKHVTCLTGSVSGISFGSVF